MLALRVALYPMAVLIGSLFPGSAILGCFGISLTVLRIAGGLVVAAGWTMLNAPSKGARPHAAALAGPDAARAMAFFPLTVLHGS